MSILKRQIVDIPLDELSDVEKTFGRLTSVDVNNIPTQLLGTFEETALIAYRHYTISAIFQSYKIMKCHNGDIYLENGSILNVGDAEDVKLLFSDALELGFLVASLKDHNNIPPKTHEEKNLMYDSFLDAWGSALIGSGEKWLTDYIRKKVIDLGLHMTNSFGPGQGNIPLEMQEVIFEKLQPEAIGVSLNSNYMMSPRKSVTGIFGIQKTPLTDYLKPCDLCNLSFSCPTAFI